MNNVVDSSAWLSYFSGDENADIFADAIEQTELLIVPSITVLEVFKHVYRQRGEDLALMCIAHMEQGQVIDLNSTVATEAAYLGITHKLPLADSIIYATAKKYDAIVWTQDADFENLDGVQYFAKPNLK